MRCRPVLALSSLMLLAMSAAPRARAQEEPTPAPTPLTVTGPPPAETPVPTLVDDIIRLWKANLSEGFIEKYVANSDLAQDLTADDVVKLRTAGVPETLITSLTERRPAGTRPRAPSARNGAQRWEGLARRNSGVVLFKSRWDPGVLEFKDGAVRWTDAKDTAKNLLIPVEQMREQQLTCLKRPGGNEYSSGS